MLSLTGATVLGLPAACPDPHVLILGLSLAAWVLHEINAYLLTDVASSHRRRGYYHIKGPVFLNKGACLINCFHTLHLCCWPRRQCFLCQTGRVLGCPSFLLSPG